jgi:hypothetical protein
MYDENKNLEISSFHLQMLYNKDFSTTWDEHGGLSGHINNAERKELRRLRSVEDQKMVNFICENVNEFPTVTKLLNCNKFLLKNIGKNKYKETDIKMSYFLLSGFSRSGGTYILNEYSNINNINLQKEHITFSHDFFPPCHIKGAFSRSIYDEDLRNYFATLITYQFTIGRKAFLKRTVLGSFYYPFIVSLSELLCDLKFHWRHSIRDLHGTIISLKKMYEGEDIVSTLLKYYEPVSTFGTDFGNFSILWFMCNTSVLPTVKDLPFWEVKINTECDVNQIKEQIEKVIGLYIKKYKDIDYYKIGRPEVMKFGKGIEDKCREDGARFNAGSRYEPEKFNFKTVIEIDDRYTEIYDFLLLQLGRLYQTFGIDFDGKLDRN